MINPYQGFMWKINYLQFSACISHFHIDAKLIYSKLTGKRAFTSTLNNKATRSSVVEAIACTLTPKVSHPFYVYVNKADKVKHKRRNMSCG